MRTFAELGQDVILDTGFWTRALRDDAESKAKAQVQTPNFIF